MQMIDSHLKSFSAAARSILAYTSEFEAHYEGAIQVTANNSVGTTAKVMTLTICLLCYAVRRVVADLQVRQPQTILPAYLPASERATTVLETEIGSRRTEVSHCRP